MQPEGRTGGGVSIFFSPLVFHHIRSMCSAHVMREELFLCWLQWITFTGCERSRRCCEWERADADSENWCERKWEEGRSIEEKLHFHQFLLSFSWHPDSQAGILYFHKDFIMLIGSKTIDTKSFINFYLSSIVSQPSLDERWTGCQSITGPQSDRQPTCFNLESPVNLPCMFLGLW